MVRCSSKRDGDSLHQLSLVSTKGQMTQFPLRLNSFTLLPVNELKHAVKEDHILLSLWNSSSLPLIPPVLLLLSSVPGGSSQLSVGGTGRQQLSLL